jgi:hypothetical protein
VRLWRRDPTALEYILIRQGQALHPPRTIQEILATLQRSAPEFVAHVVSALAPA